MKFSNTLNGLSAASTAVTSSLASVGGEKYAAGEMSPAR